MLFADVVKFSRIPEESFPYFVKHFLGNVALLTEKSPYVPIIRNTWGDALFLVFKSVEDAGCFALDLSDLMKRTDWAALGLPAELNIRIAVHAGPVFAIDDPVTGRAGYIGAHINRAARLEPVTPPGQVYASQEFAAIATLREQPFVCDYAGRIPHPKDFGTFPTYHLRRK
jgi:class 3 adenylate cyclase